MTNTFWKKLPIVLVLVAYFFVAGTFKSSAQQSGPQFLITWSSKSYTPPGYQGKVLPTANSPITASFELVDQGKILNLSGQTIYWYVDDELIGNASGKQTATFTAPSIAPGVIMLRIALPEYKNSYYFQEVRIPIVAPRAVIQSRYVGGGFSDASIGLNGLPYFFNVPDVSYLNFSWDVNGNTASSTENSQNLIVPIPPDTQSGSALNINLSITNSSDRLSSASTKLNLNYVK